MDFSGAVALFARRHSATARIADQLQIFLHL
jgi:hypothetical protein